MEPNHFLYFQYFSWTLRLSQNSQSSYYGNGDICAQVEKHLKICHWNIEISCKNCLLTEVGSSCVDLGPSNLLLGPCWCRERHPAWHGLVYFVLCCDFGPQVHRTELAVSFGLWLFISVILVFILRIEPRPSRMSVNYSARYLFTFYCAARFL